MILRFQKIKGTFFKNDSRKFSKYGGDLNNILNIRKKIVNLTAKKMIKKISKVYSMVKNDTNKSIINWEGWHKVKGTTSKIITKSQIDTSIDQMSLSLKQRTPDTFDKNDLNKVATGEGTQLPSVSSSIKQLNKDALSSTS